MKTYKKALDNTMEWWYPQNFSYLKRYKNMEIDKEGNFIGDEYRKAVSNTYMTYTGVWMLKFNTNKTFEKVKTMILTQYRKISIEERKMIVEKLKEKLNSEFPFLLIDGE